MPASRKRIQTDAYLDRFWPYYAAVARRPTNPPTAGLRQWQPGDRRVQSAEAEGISAATPSRAQGLLLAQANEIGPSG